MITTLSEHGDVASTMPKMNKLLSLIECPQEYAVTMAWMAPRMQTLLKAGHVFRI